MAFIKVTDISHHPIYVNTDHIVTVEEDGTHTRIDLDADTDHDKYIHAQESVEQIVAAIKASSM
ncbi:MAG: flagellar FlbD family protein [Verrucomicrobia bacterium]|nr:flagellar FlbD family protein [Verrucomicrobiota bacterium]